MEQLKPLKRRYFTTSKDLPLARLTGLGFNGAKVMTGRINGVAAIKRRQPMLTTIHCVCHHLALAASQAGTFIDKKFKPTLTQLFYFDQNSPACMSGLKAIQELLEPPTLKLKRLQTSPMMLLAPHWLKYSQQYLLA